MDERYSNREIDLKMENIHEKLDLILAQTTKHNGRLTKIEKVMWVVGTAVTILLIVNGSKFVEFASALTK